MNRIWLSFLLLVVFAQPSFSEAKEFISLAKLLMGHGELNPKTEEGMPVTSAYLGSIEKQIESPKLFQMAMSRLRAAHPEMKMGKIDFRGTHNKDSLIINILAIGDEPAFTRAALDALLDSLIETRNEALRKRVEKDFNAHAEAAKKAEEVLNEADAKLTSAGKSGSAKEILQPLIIARNEAYAAYRHECELLHAMLLDIESATEGICIMERATSAVEDIRVQR